MMKKIRLDVERLEVESFATQRDGADVRGTVQARCSATNGPAITRQQPTISGTMPCLCNSAGEEATCVGSCNPDMCSYFDSTCC